MVGTHCCRLAGVAVAVVARRAAAAVDHAAAAVRDVAACVVLGRTYVGVRLGRAGGRRRRIARGDAGREVEQHEGEDLLLGASGRPCRRCRGSIVVVVVGVRDVEAAVRDATADLALRAAVRRVERQLLDARSAGAGGGAATGVRVELQLPLPWAVLRVGSCRASCVSFVADRRAAVAILAAERASRCSSTPCNRHCCRSYELGVVRAVVLRTVRYTHSSVRQSRRSRRHGHVGSAIVNCGVSGFSSGLPAVVPASAPCQSSQFLRTRLSRVRAGRPCCPRHGDIAGGTALDAVRLPQSAD